MSTVLELVYQYRFLRGKCEAGRGLTIDEIQSLDTLEALFAGQRDPDEILGCRREHAREPVDLAAQLRNRRLADKVRVVDLGPGGMVCVGAPEVADGTALEVIIDDREVGLSYRFRARVAWHREDGDDAVLGLELIGTPLLVRFRSASEDGEQVDAGTTQRFDRVAA